jgi:hypothetical protein
VCTPADFEDRIATWLRRPYDLDHAAQICVGSGLLLAFDLLLLSEYTPGGSMLIARSLFVVATVLALSMSACQSNVQQNNDRQEEADARTDDAATGDSDLDTRDGDTEPRGDVDDAGDADTDGADEMPDGDTRSNEDEPDPNCHYDCPTKYSCEDGVVYQHPASIPCGRGGSEVCESAKNPDYQCEEGCFFDQVSWFDQQLRLEPKQLCNEHRPRVVGDACETDADCAPGETFTADGQEQSKELTCDPDASTCVDDAAPDYLDFCDSKVIVESGDGYIAAPQAGFPGCDDAAYCVASARGDTVCQSCTFECTADADCPSGSECRRFDALEDDRTESVQLCMPVPGWDHAESFVECRAVE